MLSWFCVTTPTAGPPPLIPLVCTILQFEGVSNSFVAAVLLLLLALTKFLIQVETRVVPVGILLSRCFACFPPFSQHKGHNLFSNTP